MIALGARLYPKQGNFYIGLWEHPIDPMKIIKRVGYRDPWFTYAQTLWAKKPRNKHLPKIFEIYRDDDTRTAYVVMERLFHLSDKWKPRIQGLERHLYWGLPMLHPDLLVLIPAIKFIRRVFVRQNRGSFDIHYYNLMMRPDGTVVFSDPLC